MATETLTPIWAGGVKKGHCAKETKSTTLMGSLRYWAEQVCRERSEQVCPGENWCDGANCRVCRIFGSTEQARAFRIEISGLKYSDDHGGLWSDEFRIRIWNRKGGADRRAGRSAGG